MSWRTIVISKRAKLDLQLGYMVVRSEEVTKIVLSEISTILIESTAVSLTTGLLAELSKRKIKVIFCDEKRNPSSELVSYYGSHDTSNNLFENDVKMYGIQTYELKSTLHNEMIRRGISMDLKYCKLEIFLPPSHLEVLQKALQEVDAGHIGNYDSCMSVSPVTGYWRPLDGCNPYIGTNGEISCEPELKVEVTVYTENVDKTIEVVKAVHPYEEPVINVIPLWRTSF